MNPTYDFTGQVALVTGGSSGMGFATARAFAEAGRRSSSRTSTRPRLVRPQRVDSRRPPGPWCSL